MKPFVSPMYIEDPKLTIDVEENTFAAEQALALLDSKDGLNGAFIATHERSRSFSTWRFLKNKFPNHIVTRYLYNGVYMVRLQEKEKYTEV